MSRARWPMRGQRLRRHLPILTGEAHMQRESFGKARSYRVTFGTLGSLRRATPKRALIVSATAGLVLGSLVAAAPVHAQSKSKQVDQITCEEFLAMQSDQQRDIAFWVDGYQTAKGDAAVGVVAFDKFGKPIGALVDECKTAPKETLWQKLKKFL